MFNLTFPSRIIPQAACARYGLAIGAKFAPFVLCLMYLFSPIAWPIAKLLDYVLGVEGPTTYKKAELRSFLQFHRNPNGQFGTYNKPSDGQDSALPLSDEEISILNGVLSLNEKKATHIMTPMEDVVTLAADQLLDHQLVDHILTSGYSRFPVHEKDKPLSFIGFLLVKRLLLYDPNRPKKVSEFKLTVLPEAKPSISCFQALDYFQTGRSHLLLISSTPGIAGGALGVVTLEDIIEEIISEEIVDETDVYEDMQTKQRAKRQGTASVMRGIVERTQRMQRRESNNSVFPINDSASVRDIPQSLSAPPTPKLVPTPTKGAAGESLRLLTPIDEAAPSIKSRGSAEGKNKNPDIVVNGQLGQNGYGATD
ncbi:hypothetical protein FRB94_010604 [Tulasnella sp. JGI-2019a]|nr:hypothetical protein FRB94_010604 [Tulasnella sp. JGI-2019a]